MEFQFERTRIDKISKETVLAQLERVAELRGFVEFGKREFDDTALISSSTAVRAFGTWSKAMEALLDTLKQRGLALKPRRKGYFAEAELFAEMERIWTTLGHRPLRMEWEAAKPRISYQTYKRYFGGWQQACLTFLEQRAGERLGTMEYQPCWLERPRKKQAIRQGTARNPREVPPGLRLKVYERDRFRCVYCGRSPSTELTVELHADPIVPFVRGGQTVLENLQTLCAQCNLGKGSRDDVRHPASNIGWSRRLTACAARPLPGACDQEVHERTYAAPHKVHEEVSKKETRNHFEPRDVRVSLPRRADEPSKGRSSGNNVPTSASLDAEVD